MVSKQSRTPRKSRPSKGSGAKSKSDMHKVYVRRRAVFLLVLAIIVALGVLGVHTVIARNSGAGDAPAQQSTSASAGTSSKTKKTDGKKTDDKKSDKKSDNANGDSTAAAKSKVRQCGRRDVRLDLDAPDPSTGVGGSIDFNATVRYEGDDQCLIDASDSSRVLTVMSGSDVIWRSDACPSDPRQLLMAKGKSMDHDEQKITWNADRSGSQCVDDSQLDRVEAGTYTASLSLKGQPAITSNKVTLSIE